MKPIHVLVGGACALAVFAAQAQVAALSFTVLDPHRDARPGTTERFSGTITNQTGASLTTGGLFFDFFNIVDPAHANFTQLLGVPDLALPAGGTSAVIDLFEVAIGPGAPIGAAYFGDITLQSMNSDIGNTESVHLRIIPEPSTYALMLSGAAVMLLGLRRRGRAANDEG